MNVYQITLPAPQGGSTPLQKFVAADNANDALQIVSAEIIALQLLGPLIKKDNK